MDHRSYAFVPGSAPRNSSPIQFRTAQSHFSGHSRHNIGSLASPRTYVTAKSSLASYATAPSGPRAGWSISHAQKSSLGVSKPIDDGFTERLAAIVLGSEKVEVLVEAIYQHILSAAGNGRRVRPLDEDEEMRLKITIRNAFSFSLHKKDGDEDDSDGKIDDDPDAWEDADEYIEEDQGTSDTIPSPEGDKRRQGAAYYDREPRRAGANAHQDESADETLEEQNDYESLKRLMRALSGYTDVKSNSMVSNFLRTSDQASLRIEMRHIFSQFLNGQLEARKESAQVFSSEWLSHLHERGILLDPKDELNWSGKGQHIEYMPEEEQSIPLTSKKVLGHSATAIVEAVQCRRILLARKKIKCNRRITKEDMITEVEHLQKLQHQHIVRIVGTYTLRKDLAILLYPVADMNLEEFMDELVERPQVQMHVALHVFPRFFGCLSNTIHYIHSQNIKHMDIKPKNILVRRVQGIERVYIADFGIARAYQSAVDAITDSPTLFTRIYAAPEVVQQDKRGFAADIFSLGCVFLEMSAVMFSTTSVDKREQLRQVRGAAYNTSIDAVKAWYRKSSRSFQSTDSHGQFMSYVAYIPSHFEAIVPNMISKDPNRRPRAESVAQCISDYRCPRCSIGPEPFEAHDVSVEIATSG